MMNGVCLLPAFFDHIQFSLDLFAFTHCLQHHALTVLRTFLVRLNFIGHNVALLLDTSQRELRQHKSQA